MDTAYQIASLANGVEAKIRPVSPHVRQGLHLRLEEALPERPAVPMKELRSIDGHSEPVMAEEGDPEYERWKADFKDWKEKSDKIEARINQENMLRLIQYAVIGWRKPVGVFLKLLRAVFRVNWFWSLFGLGWQNEPPRGWTPDKIVRVPDEINERGLYILTEVVAATSDYGLIQFAALLESHAPVTGREVERQLDGFPSDD